MLAMCYALIAKVGLQSTHSASEEGKAVCQGTVLERKDLTGDGLDNGNRAQGHTNQDATADQHRHGGGSGGYDSAREGDEWRDGCQPFPIEDIAEPSNDGGQDGLHQERTLCMTKLANRQLMLNRSSLTNDPASNGSVAQVSNDEGNHRACRHDDKDLSHDGKAGHEDDEP
jgi:hypothetical protein